jgi:hypothetical protein
MSPAKEKMAKKFESLCWKRFSENVGKLMLSVDAVGFDFTSGDMRVKMVILDTNVTSSRAKARGVSKFFTPLIIFKMVE